MSLFRMPSLGSDMERATLIEWLVEPGATVRRGDLIAVVETDKGAIEIEVFINGRLGACLVQLGDARRWREKPGDEVIFGGISPGSDHSATRSHFSQ